MADRPIPFNAPMVRALLDGRKTQTRRVAKITAIMGNRVSVGPTEELIELEEGEFRRGVMHYASTGALSGPYPVGYAVGDRLWVREAYYQCGYWEPVEGAQTKGGRQKWRFVPAYYFYTFDEPAEYRKGRHHNDPATVAWHKRLGRFMPRSYSRLTLTVTDVRVQRLQDISEADAIAEGIEQKQCPELPGVTGWQVYADPSPIFVQRGNKAINVGGSKDTFVALDPRFSYQTLWNSINGPGAWESNPWITAVSFSVAQRNIDAEARND